MTESRPFRLALQHALAGAYESNGQGEEVIEMLEQVVKFEDTTLASQHTLAIAYRANGQVRKAEERGFGDGELLLYREGFKAVYRMLRAACSSSHAFRNCRRIPDGIRVSCDALRWWRRCRRRSFLCDLINDSIKGQSRGVLAQCSCSSTQAKAKTTRRH